MRKPILYEKNKYYHIYNRGVDKRIIFNSKRDLDRFLLSMEEFNSVEPIGSIFENRFNIKNKKQSFGGETPKHEKSGRLVEILAFCLNPNHYHLILTPLVDGGISEFMKRLNGGYTNHFNQKYKRSGVLFQGVFKSVLITSDSQLRFLSVYINLNFRVHLKFQNTKNKKMFHKSSWDEYKSVKIIKGRLGKENQIINGGNDVCEKSMILSHFDSTKEYEKFAKESLKGILAKRYNDEDILKKNFTAE